MDRTSVYRSTIRHFFSPVADLLYDNDSVSEVLINGPKEIYCEQERPDGGCEVVKLKREFASEATLRAGVVNIAEYVGRPVDDRTHSLDARLPAPEQFRVHAILPPASRNGVCVSIRKFKRATTTLNWLVHQKASLTEAAAEYLSIAVAAHKNLVISGGTGSGKTSLLNALSGAILETERIVVIEDSSELRLLQPHTIYLESRPAAPDGTGTVTIRDLFVDALRMRPDRILVGEVRRGEALDMIQAMLSGHDGALSTVHAGTPRLALTRLETLCLMNEVGLPVYVARTQVAGAVHVIVQVARMADGTRKVVEIAEVGGLDDRERYRVRPLFRFRHKGRDREGRVLGTLEPTGLRSRFTRDVYATRAADQIRLTNAIFPEQQTKTTRINEPIFTEHTR